jgi:hypothetical protein
MAGRSGQLLLAYVMTVRISYVQSYQWISSVQNEVSTENELIMTELSLLFTYN